MNTKITFLRLKYVIYIQTSGVKLCKYSCIEFIELIEVCFEKYAVINNKKRFHVTA